MTRTRPTVSPILVAEESPLKGVAEEYAFLRILGEGSSLVGEFRHKTSRHKGLDAFRQESYFRAPIDLVP